MTSPARPGSQDAHTISTSLPTWQRPLVVVAHPDDESFGLGALITAFVDADATPAVLCFTHGEASTLHGRPGDLRVIRAQELRDAAAALHVDDVRLLDEPDGGLAGIEPGYLTAEVVRSAHRHAADGILTFDLDGVTSHPDHDAATRAAIAAGQVLGLRVLGWTLPTDVAATLRSEFGAPFIGRDHADLDFAVPINRTRQLAAVQAHPSQAVPGSVLWRRLELLGDLEYLRWLVGNPTTYHTP
jgi:LmbE family N-acetylglucosaminyl deacetylase